MVLGTFWTCSCPRQSNSYCCRELVTLRVKHGITQPLGQWAGGHSSNEGWWPEVMSLVLNMSNGVAKRVSGTRAAQGVCMGTEEEAATWPGERRGEAGMQRTTARSAMLRAWEDQVATGPWPETSRGPGIHVCSSPQEPLGILPLGVMSCGADSTGPCLLQAWLCSLFGCTICLFLTKAQTPRPWAGRW